MALVFCQTIIQEKQESDRYMIYINSNQEEINQLNSECYHYSHLLVQKQMEALYLKSQKLSHQDICRLCHGWKMLS